MYKIFAGLAVVFIILSIITYVCFHVKDNENFDKEINNVVKDLVEQVIMVQYKTHSADTLEKIFTEELLQELEDFYPYFYRNESFYFVNRNYMRTLRRSEEDRWYVVVGIHEGLLFGDSFFLHIGIIQKEDGSYVISFIGKDA